MSTLTEMREALEQLEQDARCFRYILSHPQSALSIIDDAQAEFESGREFDAAVRKRLNVRATKATRRAEGAGETP